MIEGIINSSWWEAAFYEDCLDQIKSPNQSDVFHTPENLPCTNFSDLIRKYPEISHQILDKCINETDTYTTYNFRLFENTFYVKNCK